MRKLLLLLVVLAMVATACGDGDGGGEDGFLACQVTDTGGIDDASFNATAWKGMEQAEDELGVEIKFVESQAEVDYVPNIQSLIVDSSTAGSLVLHGEGRFGTSQENTSRRQLGATIEGGGPHQVNPRNGEQGHQTLHRHIHPEHLPHHRRRQHTDEGDGHE